MAEVIKTGDVDLLTGKVAVLGYGSQGHAHALNLADSGVEVEVGLRPGSSSRAAAEEAGLKVRTCAEAVRGAQLVAFLVPDGLAGRALPRRGRAEPRTPDAALLFAHGFAIHYGLIEPPAGHDVIMVRAEGPGPHRAPPLRGGLRHAGADRGRAGRERPRARPRARLRGRRSAPARAGIIETTFKEETETDLFGEQSVLCGGLTQLIQLGFETLVEAGYAARGRVLRVPARGEADRRPDLRGRHRADALLDLRHRRVRLARASARASSTSTCARTCARCCAAIQDGSFAKEWIAEMDKRRAEPRRGAAASSPRPRSSRSAARCARLQTREVAGGAWRRLTSPSPCSATAPSARRSTGC